MRKLEMKSPSRRKSTSEAKVNDNAVPSESKGLFECDNQFDSGYNSGLLRDQFDSGMCLSTSSDLSIDLDSKSEEKLEQSESVFDSGLGIDSGDLDSQSVGDLPSPTCISMTEDLCWREIVEQDRDGDTLLHLVIIKGIIDVIFTFINLIPRADLLNVFNSLYQTPLHLAVMMHQPRVVRRLVVAGASVDVRDHKGNTPLHLACKWEDTECVRALVVPGIAEEIQEALIRYPVGLYQLPTKVLQLRNYEGETCVHTATRVGHLKILEILVSCGANVNARDGKSGNTALHICVESRQVSLVSYLLRQCRAAVNLKNYAGMTALHVAWNSYKRRPDQQLKALMTLLKKNGGIPIEAPESDSATSESSDEDSDADNENREL